MQKTIFKLLSLYCLVQTTYLQTSETTSAKPKFTVEYTFRKKSTITPVPVTPTMFLVQKPPIDQVDQDVTLQRQRVSQTPAPEDQDDTEDQAAEIPFVNASSTPKVANIHAIIAKAAVDIKASNPDIANYQLQDLLYEFIRDKEFILIYDRALMRSIIDKLAPLDTK